MAASGQKQRGETAAKTSIRLIHKLFLTVFEMIRQEKPKFLIVLLVSF